jgi:acetyl esterase
MPEGRLADPDRSIRTDPRADPRMAAAFARVGLDRNLSRVQLTRESPVTDRLKFCDVAEELVRGTTDHFAQTGPAVEGVRSTTTAIRGADGNEITLYISRPPAAPDVLPVVVHLHGGAMAISSAGDIAYTRWRESLAGTGLVVVGVEFRNSGGRLGPHPYPAGLNDCASAVQWVAAHRADLGAGRLVISGESGGGNLTLAVSLVAKRDGWLAEIAGLYAQCPYISNRWEEQPDELPSLKENDGYFISCQQSMLMGTLYDPDNKHAREPTCWPGVATADDLDGLPPHVISVNELDPLRDEGLQYYRTLLRAGVSAVGRVVAGTCHGGDILLPGILPDVYAASLRDLNGFAHSL